MAKIKTIRMIRDAAVAQNGVTEADVHPDEVMNYAAAGFIREDGKPPEPPAPVTITRAEFDALSADEQKAKLEAGVVVVEPQ